MAEYQMVVGGFLNEPLTGRRPIETPETEINRENVLKVVMGKAEPIHLLNKNEIRFLHNYYLGSQPVLHRTKEYHSEITNRIVENHANECVGFYTGYMSGLKVRTADFIRERHPERMILDAVWGMMPKGRMGRAQYKKLKVYAGAEHPHVAQQCTPLAITLS